jgi:hypothetical protein
MKLIEAILILELLCPVPIGNAFQIQSAPVRSNTLAASQQISTKPPASEFVNRPEANFDVRNYGVVGDGTSDDTKAMTALLTTIGPSPAVLIFPTRVHSLLNAISFPANVTLDFSAGGALKPATGQTISIAGRILGGRQQIFVNSLAGHGTVDLTGNYALEAVYPEWWGASPRATAEINTPAIQAAILGAFGSNRTNASGLAKYNRVLRFSGMYKINGELKCYHMIGFRWEGDNKFGSGLMQTATNKRIIDGQSVAYGVFDQIRWETSASQNVPLMDLDYSGAQGDDLRPQNITFYDNVWGGDNVGQLGPLISKSGGGAQGDNIRFFNNYFSGFTEACAQVGGNNTGVNVGRFYAFNAMLVTFQGGDVQSCPHYGIASYSGSTIVKDVSFENGFQTQTGFDVYCESAQAAYGCTMENVRSESRRLMAGNRINIKNSYTINQASFPTPQQSLPVGYIITGSAVGGDGAYYKVTVNGIFGGVGTPARPEHATSGSATAIINSLASYKVNAFTGFRASIVAGTGIGHYCVVTANDTTTIACSAGWVSDYDKLADADPDSTSQFVVEPNWGTQFTSGACTFAALNENGIDGDNGGVPANAVLDGVDVPGDKIRAEGVFRRVTVSRADWNGNPALDNHIVIADYDVRLDPTIGIGGATYYKKWQFLRNGPSSGSFLGYSQRNMGTQPIVWSAGQAGGGISATDVWVGGRSDPESKNSMSRAVLETGGMLGRPTPSGSNKNGTPMQIQGGLPTGSGAPGAIEFWMGKSGSSGSRVLDGVPVAGIRENGLSWTLLGTAIASGSIITPSGNLFHVTGTTSITSISGVGVTAGTEITLIFDGTLIVRNGSNLRLASDFTTAPTNTLTLKWDGSDWFEQSRSTEIATVTTVGAGMPANTDFIGELTASNSSVTYTFTGRYASHPICVASDETTVGGGIRVTYSGATSVTFSTPGVSDVLSYVCFKRN